MRSISNPLSACGAPGRPAFLLSAFLASAWICAVALPAGAGAARAAQRLAPAGRAVVSADSGAQAGARRGGEMVRLGGGLFMMGSGSGAAMGSDATADHSPAHAVRLAPFFIDRYEVTNAQYVAFCRETKRGLPMFWGIDTLRSGPDYPDHPVVGVSWVDAKAYAEWCGRRLPTEAEWEYAARGGLFGREYVNADTLAPGDANFTRAHRGGTTPVGSYPPNGFGLYDMVGNVAEWVSDWYADDAYAASPADDPKGPGEGKFKVIRGGGWHTGPGCSKVYVRYALPWGWLDFNVGFRCAKDAGPPAGTAAPDSVPPPPAPPGRQR